MTKHTNRWPAPAKLNLFLNITGQRANGYHELQTLFQFIDVCDYLTFEPNRSGKINITPGIEGVRTEDNLIYKAAAALRAYGEAELGASINLEKNLPMGGGLGGGSSDAATTLVALNQLWNLHLPSDKLAEIGVKLGADIPIFINGQASVAEGVGEILTPACPEQLWYFVAVPDCHVSTVSIFTDPDLIRDTPKQPIDTLLSSKWKNDCEPLVKKRHPEVAKIAAWLLEYAPSRLTGTGACVFASCNSRQDAQSIMDNAPHWLHGFVARGRNQSPLMDVLVSAKK